ncbi:hypothetical protein BV22DRAFT_200724 [Leucogyrophana mollusca]|uniref:Uncharacterized protein n=1 Tax=Leucogyrophana mollusca TaxID=85980 RepID=A0ACB8BRE9_9AGAM|nr:hypothetical protein BV22DRAFT_200724 [Leucogyrophana mollusca]
MLRHAASRTASQAQVFDFLAPCVYGYRSASSKTPPPLARKPKHDTEKLAAFPVPVRGKDPTVICNRIKERISFLNQPSVTVTPDPDISFFNETVVKLRQALKLGDVRRTRKYWTQLEERKLLRLLGPQLHGYSKLAAALCPRSPGKPWEDEERKAIEEIALVAAAGDAVDALKACMVTHINRRDSAAALDLYQRFLLLSGSKQSWQDDLAQPTGDGVGSGGLALNLSTDSHSRSPLKVTILLAAITAHAVQDSFENALETFLSSPTRISQFTMKDFLRSIDDKSLCEKVEEYVRRLDTARLISQPLFLSRHISKLTDNEDVPRLEKLYHAIVIGMSGSDPFLASGPSDVTPHKPISVQEVNWAAFLTAFLRCRRRDLAEKLWDDMLRHGFKPTVTTWTALLEGYDSMGEAEDALTAWNGMLSQGIKPDILSYRALISALYNARRPDEALKSFAAFEQGLSKGTLQRTADTLAVYNSVLHGLLTNGREADANTLLQRIRKEGPKPDIVTYNTFLRHHGRKGEFRAVSSVVERLTEDGLTGDVFTFSSILSALLKVGRTDATDLVLTLMKKQNVEPNVAVFSSIIDQQAREGTEQGFRAALDLLQKMELNPDAQPNEVTYTSILANVHRGMWTNPALAAECKQYILGRMKARNIQPNRVTYNILLRACLENPDKDGLQSALGYYREMVVRKIPMTYDTWYILLHGLITREEWAVADELVEDLTKYLVPEGALASLVGRIRRRTMVTD